MMRCGGGCAGGHGTELDPRTPSGGGAGVLAGEVECGDTEEDAPHDLRREYTEFSGEDMA